MAGFWWGFSENFDVFKALSPLLQQLERKRELEYELERMTRRFPLELEQQKALLGLQEQFDLDRLRKEGELRLQQKLKEEEATRWPVGLREDIQKAALQDIEAQTRLLSYSDLSKKVARGEIFNEDDLKTIGTLPIDLQADLLNREYQNKLTQVALKRQEEELKIRKEEAKSRAEYREQYAENQALRTAGQLLRSAHNYLSRIQQNYLNASNELTDLTLEALRLKTQLYTAKLPKKEHKQLLADINRVEAKIEAKRAEVDNIKQELLKGVNTIDEIYQTFGFAPTITGLPESTTQMPTISQPASPSQQENELLRLIDQAAETTSLEEALNLLGVPEFVKSSLKQSKYYSELNKIWSEPPKDKNQLAAWKSAKAASLRNLINALQQYQ